MKSLKIKTSETMSVKDKTNTYKKWFNGMKHFFTIKLLPPKQ